MGATGIIVVWIGLALSGLAGSAWLLHRMWRRRASVGNGTKAVAFVFGAGAGVGGFGTLAGLASGVSGLAGFGDPAERARTLAEGISEAMNCFALGLSVSGPALAVLLVLMRGRWKEQPQEGAGE
jgi:biopolymer transport protein ExbB/TolQ